MKERQKNLLYSEKDYSSLALQLTTEIQGIDTSIIDLGINLLLVSNAVFMANERYFNKIETPSGKLSPGKFVVLILLSVSPQQQSNLTELAEKWTVTVGAISKVVKGLMADGYVELQKSSKDSRVRVVTLNEKGFNVLNSILRNYSYWLSETFSNVNKNESKSLVQAALKSKTLFSNKLKGKNVSTKIIS